MTNGKTDLSSARAKLNWANAQIDILDAEIRAFIECNPYSVREKPKPHLQLQREPNAAQRDLFDKGRFYEILLTEKIPKGIDTSTGMIIQALRDSLDHLAHALAEKNGAVEPKDVYFPITETKDGFPDPRTQRKIARLSEDDRTAIEALKPYQGGNDLLYAIHWLNNKSKHRKLIAIAAGVHSFGFGGGPVACEGY